MKKCFTALIVFCAMLVNGQEFKETINKELKFSNASRDNMLVATNIFGNVSVEGYSGNTVKVSIEKTLTADSPSDLEKGKKELKIIIEEKENKIIVRPDAPYISYHEDHSFNYNNYGKDIPYHFHLEMTIKVPQNVNVSASTVNDGEILVKNLRTNLIKAYNVNGGIELDKVAGKTKAHTVNGKVTVTYVENPRQDSSYYSLNGNITVNYLQNLNAEVTFKSMNGSFFTEFDVEGQRPKVVRKSEKKGKRVKYRYESKPAMKIGNGGTTFSFETLNGNVYLKKV